MSSFVDVFCNSKELKRTIVDLSTRHQIPFRYICREIQVDYKYFMQAYINSDAGKIAITEYQAKKLLALLGITVRTQFIISTDHPYAEVQQKLKEKYGYEHWTQKKEGPSTFADGSDILSD